MTTPTNLNDSVIVRTDAIDGILYVDETLPLLLEKLNEGIKLLEEHNKNKNVNIKKMKLVLTITYGTQDITGV